MFWNDAKLVAGLLNLALFALWMGISTEGTLSSLRFETGVCSIETRVELLFSLRRTLEMIAEPVLGPVEGLFAIEV